MLKKIGDFSNYEEICKPKNIRAMRACALHKWSKVQPRALNGELRAKKRVFPAKPRAFQGNTTESVILTPSQHYHEKVGLSFILLSGRKFIMHLTSQYKVQQKQQISREILQESYVWYKSFLIAITKNCH